MATKTPREVETTELDRRLDGMPRKWAVALDSDLREWSASGVFVDDESGAMFVGHRPAFGPLNYAFVLFPPASSEDIARYEKTVNVKLPAVVKDYLGAFNGGNFLEFGLGGADKFYSHNPWPDHHPHRHCRDVGGQYRILQRSKATRGLPMVFASRNASLEVVQSYAQMDNGTIATWDRATGKLLKTWDDPIDWFSTELAGAKAFTDEWNNAMAELRR